MFYDTVILRASEPLGAWRLEKLVNLQPMAIWHWAPATMRRFWFGPPLRNGKKLNSCLDVWHLSFVSIFSHLPFSLQALLVKKATAWRQTRRTLRTMRSSWSSLCPSPHTAYSSRRWRRDTASSRSWAVAPMDVFYRCSTLRKVRGVSKPLQISGQSKYVSVHSCLVPSMGLGSIGKEAHPALSFHSLCCRVPEANEDRAPVPLRVAKKKKKSNSSRCSFSPPSTTSFTG